MLWPPKGGSQGEKVESCAAVLAGREHLIADSEPDRLCLNDRIGSQPLLVAGMALMSGGLQWIAAVSSPTVPYLDLVPAFMMAGVGMSLYFAPVANLVLSAVRREKEGKASGVNNTVREVGGVFGVALLSSVFSAVRGYASGTTFVHGMVAAVWVGAALVGLGTFAALAIPRRQAPPASACRPATRGCITSPTGP